MSLLLFALLIMLGSFAGGLLGAMTGLGGGIIVVPLLTLGFGIELRYAIGASLISIIATSSGAAAAYVREGYTNVRVGMFLEVATTVGAITGALIAGILPADAIGVVFGLVLLFTAYRSLRTPEDHSTTGPGHPWAERLKLASTYPSSTGLKAYSVHAVPFGFSIMYVAGILSGLLGIGSGVVKVLAMDQGMKLPFKVSTTTSNFMIGVTGAASAGVYLHRGLINPVIALPVMLGVLGGALLGARLLVRIRTRALRRIFTVVVTLMAAQMLYKGFTGGF